MTGNFRYNLGLLVVALIGAFLGWLAMQIEPARDIGGILLFGAIVLALAALVKIATDLLRSPQRD